MPKRRGGWFADSKLRVAWIGMLGVVLVPLVSVVIGQAVAPAPHPVIVPTTQAVDPGQVAWRDRLLEQVESMVQLDQTLRNIDSWGVGIPDEKLLDVLLIVKRGAVATIGEMHRVRDFIEGQGVPCAREMFAEIDKQMADLSAHIRKAGGRPVVLRTDIEGAKVLLGNTLTRYHGLLRKAVLDEFERRKFPPPIPPDPAPVPLTARKK